MCDENIGSVRRLTEEELKTIWKSRGTPIEPDESGNYKVPFRFSIDLKDWRGFTGTQIEIVDKND